MGTVGGVEPIGFDDVSVAYDAGPPALDHLDLTIGGGELFGLVGPSGCGKTTALRVLAGLERPTSGRIRHGGRDITKLPARKRRFGYVTQQNQLMDHLTTAGNIAFPLELAPRRRGDRPRERAREEAARLGIEHLLDARPTTLSEGQRRLAQLARAIIGAPGGLLLDEPLGFLEQTARVRVRAAIAESHHERGLTSVMATADQGEAMHLCDRIAVLFDGVVEQVAPPQVVYARPATARVAAFFGEPEMNIVPAAVHVRGPDRFVEVLGHPVRLRTPELDVYAGRSVLVGIRPDDVEVGGPSDRSVGCLVERSEGHGSAARLRTVAPDGTTIRCSVGGRAPSFGAVLDVAFPADRLHLFDPSTGIAIHHPPVA